ncbi:MAG TPA: hypothetical protein PKD61_37685, partial [Polyangiaceae bacterium]|nr:hypothetical protein [Polyangiaceae bacterium]
AGSTLVAVLHDLNHAARYATHLIAMKDGAVVAQGAPGEIVTAELGGCRLGSRGVLARLAVPLYLCTYVSNSAVHFIVVHVHGAANKHQRSDRRNEHSGHGKPPIGLALKQTSNNQAGNPRPGKRTFAQSLRS